jgi:hypothetical protein
VTATTEIIKNLGPGRPPDDSTLYIADAILGLTRVRKDIQSKVEIVANQVFDQVADSNGTVETKMTPLLLPDGVVVGPKTGKVYFTDASNVPVDRIPHPHRKKKKSISGI